MKLAEYTLLHSEIAFHEMTGLDPGYAFYVISKAGFQFLAFHDDG
jgi:hypothetical protein